MSLRDLRRQLQRLRRAIDPTPPPPPAPLGPPKVIFCLPDNGRWGDPAYPNERGPGRYRNGDVETWIFTSDEAAAACALPAGEAGGEHADRRENQSSDGTGDASDASGSIS